MTPIILILGITFIALAVIWPLAYFGQQYWKELVAAEEAKHAQEGGKH
jgi:hypothetical protein